MKNIKLVQINDEIEIINKLGNILLDNGYNASNSIIVTVSTDYSSIVGQILRHQLSDKGEICEGFGVDVPYPDETWDNNYINTLNGVFVNHNSVFKNKNIILVEAGVIRGGNYEFLTTWIKHNYNTYSSIVTTSMFENINSKFKSDYVIHYYDDSTDDLTFWWERENNHWK